MPQRSSSDPKVVGRAIDIAIGQALLEAVAEGVTDPKVMAEVSLVARLEVVAELATATLQKPKGD